ncbi:NUDIX domain-containing protein [Streptomyces sp. LP05-1]|uniref:NUDIX domain-containing protein n=1 Tax=Streptomyces pyxinae TaxID=2970734 RepID=A0ABT2CH86_9ACTN|nr:NUDIX domain-containing protein [Streptomyces sp. LP05-1]MCS0636076.1 NUDIX domain-containing protein [Streptomyces sp. LP05-1]
MSSADEILDVVDERDRVVGQAPRGEVYARALRHRCVFVLARDAEDRIFVHRRTPVKAIFPSRYDMFVGGVVGAGESYDEAALREAEEELGVRGLPRPVPLFRFFYDSGEYGHGSWWSAVYEVRCELPVSPQVEEVAWHTFLPEPEVVARLADWDWVPDGVAAYERLRDWREWRERERRERPERRERRELCVRGEFAEPGESREPGGRGEPGGGGSAG